MKHKVLLLLLSVLVSIVLLSASVQCVVVQMEEQEQLDVLYKSIKNTQSILTELLNEYQLMPVLSRYHHSQLKAVEYVPIITHTYRNQLCCCTTGDYSYSNYTDNEHIHNRRLLLN